MTHQKTSQNQVKTKSKDKDGWENIFTLQFEFVTTRTAEAIIMGRRAQKQHLIHFSRTSAKPCLQNPICWTWLFCYSEGSVSSTHDPLNIHEVTGLIDIRPNNIVMTFIPCWFMWMMCLYYLLENIKEDYKNTYM